VTALIIVAAWFLSGFVCWCVIAARDRTCTTDGREMCLIFTILGPVAVLIAVATELEVIFAHERHTLDQKRELNDLKTELSNILHHDKK